MDKRSNNDSRNKERKIEKVTYFKKYFAMGHIKLIVIFILLSGVLSIATLNADKYIDISHFFAFFLEKETPINIATTHAPKSNLPKKISNSSVTQEISDSSEAKPLDVEYEELPDVVLSVKPLDLSRTPSADELMAAGQLGGPLYPVKEVDKKGVVGKKRRAEINLSFGLAIEAWNTHRYKEAVKLFQEHVEKYGDSPWVGESILHIGCDARYNGRYVEAEEAFQQLIENYQASDYIGAKMLYNKALSRLGVLRMLQNDYGAAEDLFSELRNNSPDWRHRTYAAYWLQRISLEKASGLSMLNCGMTALSHMLKKEGKDKEATEVVSLVPETSAGFSFLDLKDKAAKFGIDTTALKVERNDISNLPLPAIVRIEGTEGSNISGHYWILEKAAGKTLQLYDTQSGRRFIQTPKEFSKQWNGEVFVFSNKTDLPGTVIDDQKMDQITGGCCGVPRPPANLGKTTEDGTINLAPTSGGNNSLCGTPVWSVNMTSLNLFITDVPLWYSPSTGPAVNIKLSYNAQASITHNEPFGNKWMFNYASYIVMDPGGSATIFMGDGRKDVYTPDVNGKYHSPTGVLSTLEKIKENHFLLKSLDGSYMEFNIPEGTTSQQPFMVKMSDRYGKYLSFGYNQAVQLDKITDATGKITTITYNEQGKITAATDPFGRTASFNYDDKKNLTRITDMGGYWTAFTYDKSAYPTSMKDDRGETTFYVEPADGINNGAVKYNPPGTAMWANYRITVTNQEGNKEEYYYEGYSGYTWHVSPNNYIEWENSSVNNLASNTPKTVYNFLKQGSGPMKGKINKITTPEGLVTEYGFNLTTGRAIWIKDPAKKTTHFKHNAAGQFTEITNPEGKTTNFSYAENKIDLLKVSNDLGSVSYEYNEKHDPVSITDTSNNKTFITYNDLGLPVSVVDPSSRTISNIYDENFNLIEVRVNDKTVEKYTYDEIGRVNSTTNSAGLTLHYEHNDLNHLMKTTWPDGRSENLTYSGCCPRLVESATMRSGRQNTYHYDDLKRLIETVTPSGLSYQNQYDANGNLTGFLDSKENKTAFKYDRDDRLIRRTYPDGKHVDFQFDATGRPIKKTNARGIETRYLYDDTGNLQKIDYSDDTPDVEFGFDEFGRTVWRIDATGKTVFTYSKGSNLKSIDGPLVGDTITYLYDNLNRMTNIEPENGRKIAINYDDLDRIITIKSGDQNYTYTYTAENPFPDSLIRPNGTVTAYSYNGPLKRLTGISNKKASLDVISGYSFAYDDEANPDKRSKEILTGGTAPAFSTEGITTYENNELNQVIGSKPPEKAYAYDASGNMTKGFTPKGYRFTAAYDAENRLKSIEYSDKDGDTHRREYIYQANSFLAVIKKYKNGNKIDETRIIRSGFLPIQERSETNKVIREYTWGQDMGGGIGGLLNMATGGNDYYYLYDGRGNVTGVVDSKEQLAASYAYDAFGNVLSKTGSLDQPFMFSTKRFDADLGLSYYGYRFYGAGVGKWMTRDPLGEIGGINLYGFVAGNSVNWVDPWGLEGTAVVIGVGAAGNSGVGTAIITGAVTGVGIVGVAVSSVVLLPSTLGDGTLSGPMLSEFPPGYRDAVKGAEEWGRRNGIGKIEGRRRFHKKKQECGGSGANEDYGVNPDTGDIIDSNGDWVDTIDD